LKKLIILSILVLGGFSVGPFGSALSDESQREILDRLLYIRGLGPLPASIDTSQPSGHCGTQDAFIVFINRGEFDAKYKTPLAMASDRPINLPLSYISPAGHYNIHYTTSGIDSVYRSHEDINPADGIPDYVNKIGQIADSVYNFEITHLGYPPPPSDGLAGGDSLYDIYIHNLGINYYGMTTGDSAVSSQRATSYLEIDNDYNFFPYTTRPLDAARVTIAHEFFHAVHFGMDYTEYEGTPSDPRLYWWEMSATWMEEMAYDGINDYYGYLPGFYDYPWVSLTDFTVGFSMHPYGSAVFPIFLTEKWDTLLVQDIWFRCRDYGTGAQFLRAADDAIFHFDSLMKADQILADSSYIDSVYHLHHAFREFAVWNLFTGSRAARAPAGIGFSERANYSMIPDSAFITHDTYPLKMIWPNWRDSLPYYGVRVPQNLGANYINLESISLLDSLRFAFYGVRNTTIDLKWDLSMVAFPLNVNNPAVVDMKSQAATGVLLDLWQTGDYYNIVAIPTPVSIYNSAYPGSYGFAYLISDTADIDTSGYEIMAPYPNPMVVSSNDDIITFRLRQPLVRTKSASFKVYIYDIAGEKIKELEFIVEDQDLLTLKWPLDNHRKEKVAPGVYLALCRATFSDGTPELIKKFKLAVIK
jgi:hypothetical protein